MTRLPSLGPRGEGWVLLQAVLLVAIPLAAWQAAMTEQPGLADQDLVRRAGGILLIAGLGVIGASVWSLNRGRALSALPHPLETATLVESGPYRFVRHPIYSGLILAGIGAALIRLSPIVGVLTLILAVVLDLKRRREEAWLQERYPAYAAYRSRTRALIPFLY
jgi:protein-S-isoprenylcysteine O-methyltransferase Ste14